MYSMKQACHKTELSYKTLKFYCNQGLVPNVKRDHNNLLVFDDRDITWIQSLNCLKNCGMGITEMKVYIALCMKGEASIPERKRILSVKKDELMEQMQRIRENRTVHPCFLLESI